MLIKVKIDPERRFYITVSWFYRSNDPSMQ